jgi:hypothetical protein
MECRPAGSCLTQPGTSTPGGGAPAPATHRKAQPGRGRSDSGRSVRTAFPETSRFPRATSRPARPPDSGGTPGLRGLLRRRLPLGRAAVGRLLSGLGPAHVLDREPPGPEGRLAQLRVPIEVVRRQGPVRRGLDTGRLVVLEVDDPLEGLLVADAEEGREGQKAVARRYTDSTSGVRDARSMGRPTVDSVSMRMVLSPSDWRATPNSPGRPRIRVSV